jgi:hypothetical protein
MNSKLSVEDNQKLLEPWLAVIGLVTVMWSPVERKIDECVVLIASKKNKKKPFTLSHKLNYIHDNSPENLTSTLDVIELIRVTKETAQVRDVCVHGVIESYDNEQMVIGKVEGKSQEYKIEMFTFDKKRLNSAGNNLTYLNQSWEMLLDELYTALKNG